MTQPPLDSKILSPNPWKAPLVPVAICFTLGIFLDRVGEIPFYFSLGLVLLFLFFWRSFLDRKPQWAFFFLNCSLIGLGAAYNQARTHLRFSHDISTFGDSEERFVKVQGRVDSEPVTRKGNLDHPLQSYPSTASTRLVLAVDKIHSQGDWQRANGLLQVSVSSPLIWEIHVGDEVEFTGRLHKPHPPGNPGERNFADYLRQKGIGAILNVSASGEGGYLISRGWPTSVQGMLAALRSRCNQILKEYFPEGQRDLAGALLLGDDAALAAEEWDKYLQTGVIHVLAISGQHLSILAGFLWMLFRFGHFRRSYLALAIVLFLWAYALLSGGRPPVIRAAWMFLIFAGGIWFRRQVQPANALALAWLGIALAQPGEIFQTGCQLSFLAVGALMWGPNQWWKSDPDPLAKVIQESRPWLLQWAIFLGKKLFNLFLLNAWVGIVVAPLVASRYHLFSPISLLIGPLMVGLTTLALLTGFVFFLVSWITPLALIFAWFTKLFLQGCEVLVSWSQALPGAYTFCADIPDWWLLCYYLFLGITFTIPAFKNYWKIGLGFLIAWLALGVGLQFRTSGSAEFRCTFLSVGHGGCVVMETPEGKVFLYDAGTLVGPDVTRKQIAPFLWQRNIRYIDQVFISHADLDHFNGLVSLVERFGIGKVALTPTFASRQTPGVEKTLTSLREKGIPITILHQGTVIQEGALRIEVLHPPEKGPEGNENARSMVLEIDYLLLKILLTGDLEGKGLTQVLQLPAKRIDVLMAPHHGSKNSNIDALAAWANPQVVVSCQGVPKKWNPNPYEKRGGLFLPTHAHGAITIQNRTELFTVQPFLTKSEWNFSFR